MHFKFMLRPLMTACKQLSGTIFKGAYVRLEIAKDMFPVCISPGTRKQNSELGILVGLTSTGSNSSRPE